MSRPRLLDLYCGAGGAAMGYHRAGFDVVGVDIEAQPRYPFEFHRADALSILRAMVDYPTFSGEMWRPGYFQAIHASPPCRDHSSLASVLGLAGSGHLLSDTRALLIELGLPYVIENVSGADMPGALVLCGSEFGLTAVNQDGEVHWLKRHRQFESNLFMFGAGGCHCYGKPIMGVFGDLRATDRRTTGGGKPPKMRASVTSARELLGCPWMTGPELSQAIPPAYTEYVGGQILDHLAMQATP